MNGEDNSKITQESTFTVIGQDDFHSFASAFNEESSRIYTDNNNHTEYEFTSESTPQTGNSQGQENDEIPEEDKKHAKQSQPQVPRKSVNYYLKIAIVGGSQDGRTELQKTLLTSYYDHVKNFRDTSDATWEQFQKDPKEFLSRLRPISNDDNSVIFRFSIQNTPALDSRNEKQLEILERYVTGAIEAYYELDRDVLVDKEKMVDNRVDAVLYILPPKLVSSADVEAMKRIANSNTAVLPVINKADCLQDEQRQQIRQDLVNKLGVNMFQYSQESIDILGVENARPPFFTVCGNKVDSSVHRFWLVRQFPWGNIAAFRSRDSDFKILRQLLFEVGFHDLKAHTNECYREYCKKFLVFDSQDQKEQQGEQEQKPRDGDAHFFMNSGAQRDSKDVPQADPTNIPASTPPSQNATFSNPTPTANPSPNTAPGPAPASSSTPIFAGATQMEQKQQNNNGECLMDNGPKVQFNYNEFVDGGNYKPPQRANYQEVSGSTRRNAAGRDAGGQCSSSSLTDDFNSSQCLEVFVESVNQIEGQEAFNVHLVTMIDQQILPLQVSRHEGIIMKNFISGLNWQPSVYQLWYQTLVSANRTIRRMVFEEFKNQMFLTSLHIFDDEGNLVQKLQDCRPSYAINLALLFGAKLYVNVNVMDQVRNVLHTQQ
eukprot:TRINITY_DN767_c1_g1_i1.p1 TRINITY_DN767_c1_g1~~TRINITY_DN767_c1_g1_i1.p1  ORF type:complete len:657 (-),score=67.28 TRINITY_DN767_c1_g1_i1:1958-3928(-)